MKRTLALILGVAVLIAGCGNMAGESTKSLTVTELNVLNKKDAADFKAKHDGKKIVASGPMKGTWSDDPEYFKPKGHQVLLVGANEGPALECLVKQADAGQFKGVKADEMLTVTGKLKVGEYTMELEDCTKFNAAAK